MQLLQPQKKLLPLSMAGIIRRAMNAHGFRAGIQHLLCVTVDIPQRLRFIGHVPLNSVKLCYIVACVHLLLYYSVLSVFFVLC